MPGLFIYDARARAIGISIDGWNWSIRAHHVGNWPNKGNKSTGKAGAAVNTSPATVASVAAMAKKMQVSGPAASQKAIIVMPTASKDAGTPSGGVTLPGPGGPTTLTPSTAPGGPSGGVTVPGPGGPASLPAIPSKPGLDSKKDIVPDESATAYSCAMAAPTYNEPPRFSTACLVLTEQTSSGKPVAGQPKFLTQRHNILGDSIVLMAPVQYDEQEIFRRIFYSYGPVTLLYHPE